MIEDGVEIFTGMVVRHDEGLHYRVDKINRISTIDWEKTHKLGSALIDYTQLEDGDKPAGTEYGKDEEGFRRHFTIISQLVSSQHPEQVVIEVLREIRPTS